jgi:hypothetical protein
LTIEEVIQEFSRADGAPLKEAIQWSLDHWEEVLPTFLGWFDRSVPVDPETVDPRWFMTHLAGGKREPRAHAAICRMVRDASQVDRILGDSITEDLGRILISTFDGDPGSLMAIIEDEEAEEFVRAQALDALTYLYAHGELPNFDMRAYIGRLSEDLRPRSQSVIWAAWAEAVAHLGYAELTDAVRDKVASGFIDEFDMGQEDFEEILARSREEGPIAALAYDRVQPYGDALETIAEWISMSGGDDEYEDEDDSSSLPKDYWPQIPAINPLRDVGRNDPCPCGSGKKFKKCCLGLIN